MLSPASFYQRVEEDEFLFELYDKLTTGMLRRGRKESIKTMTPFVYLDSNLCWRSRGHNTIRTNTRHRLLF